MQRGEYPRHSSIVPEADVDASFCDVAPAKWTLQRGMPRKEFVPDGRKARIRNRENGNGASLAVAVRGNARWL